MNDSPRHLPPALLDRSRKKQTSNQPGEQSNGTVERKLQCQRCHGCRLMGVSGDLRNGSDPSRSFSPFSSTSIWDSGAGGGIRPEKRNTSASPTSPAPGIRRLAARIAFIANRTAKVIRTVPANHPPATQTTSFMTLPTASIFQASVTSPCQRDAYPGPTHPW